MGSSIDSSGCAHSETLETVILLKTVLIYLYIFFFSQKLLCTKGFCIQSENFEEKVDGSRSYDASSFTVYCHLHAGLSLPEAC